LRFEEQPCSLAITVTASQCPTHWRMEAFASYFKACSAADVEILIFVSQFVLSMYPAAVALIL